MVRVTGSYTNQSCPEDKYGPFEPSSSPLGHSQVAQDPPWPKDGAARQPWLGLLGHVPAKTVTVAGNAGIFLVSVVDRCTGGLAAAASLSFSLCCAQQCGGQVKSTVCTAVRAHWSARARQREREREAYCSQPANICQFCPTATGQKRFWPFLRPLAF